MIASKSFFGLLALVSLSMVSAAEHNEIKQCKTEDCNSDCPRSLFVDVPGDADGLGIIGSTIVWHDVSEPDEGCAYILLSPANVDEPNCGTPVGQFRHATCVRHLIAGTYMWQRCCGQECTDAGVSRRAIRGANWLGQRSNRRDNDLEGSLVTLSAYNNGSPVEVHSSRPASHKQTLARRDCSGFNEERRRSTSVSATVGDPFGIVSTTVGFETTEEASTSLTYTLELTAGQFGTASWTPTLDCVEGTFTGCGDAGDQKGNVCTPSLAANNEARGVYRTVLQS
ncbi:hypothetical protein CF336_g4250 [Tilletia laevis]|nr:hypothetical protein CF336_g4250 [Tilletia laevis]KAE8197108.1 hypothetical protein CF328_g3944 [Tilletia controversa]KAE8202444.1 hypothetical protein CF335_g3414 [Tilletia laevis]